MILEICDAMTFRRLLINGTGLKKILLRFLPKKTQGNGIQSNGYFRPSTVVCVCVCVGYCYYEL